MEDEIKVGDWIRTNWGHIGKLKRIELDKNDKGLKWYIFDHKEFEINIIKEEYINKPYIVKYSPNIIDLIECGDYVNGRKVQRVFIDPFTKKKRLLIEGTEVNWQGDMSSIYFEADEIKSIVTHEKFKSIEYTIHEREEKENDDI
jgi:hypothetical protein